MQRKKKTTLFNNLSPLHHRSAILENIRWTQTAYVVLCQPRHTDELFSFISKHKQKRCGAADTEERTQFASTNCVSDTQAQT